MASETVKTEANVAFLFPGQASQAVGMGKDLYEESPAAREIFNEVDETLGRSLTSLMFDGPIEDLTNTANAQPAIAAVSLATHASLTETLGYEPRPAMSAGHSLGEYSALAVSGVLSLPDTIKLVVERGRVMQVACDERPGGMAALIGIDEFAAEDVCRETGVHISNINTSEQIIISGDHRSLAQAIDLAAARGARKCISLPVGGAFHSGLMEPAQSGLNEVIDSLEFNDPAVPIIGNCEAKPMVTGDDVRAELQAQLVSCVQWNRSICYMAENGVDSFLEIGPGKVLSGMIRRIDRSLSVTAIGSMDAIRAYVA